MVTTALRARDPLQTPLQTPLPTTSRQAVDDAPRDASPKPAIAESAREAAPTEARTPATREQQTAARMRASSGASALEASLRARVAPMGATTAATATTAPTAPATESISDPRVAEYEQNLAAYTEAFGLHQSATNDYWKATKEKRAKGEYVTEQPPPKYAGPPKPVHPTDPEPEPTTPSTIPTKATFVAAAKDVYGFAPEQGSEDEFKQSYAREAIKAGLTADEVTRVYAFETGGDGKFDLQPIRKDGTAISTALGYAQLLNANSVLMLAKHGEQFAKELDAAGKPEKAAIVRRMSEDAKKVPEKWDDYQTFAKTPSGRAMHALNLDKDIGPKMQMQKVKDIHTAAKAAGQPNLSPAQLELLNLAGEKNGLLMLKPELKGLPTANFFDRAGYDANPVVHQRSADALLARIDELMTKNVQKPGAVAFRAAFDAQLSRD